MTDSCYTIAQGEDKAFPFYFQDSDGNAIPITADTFQGRARETIEDTGVYLFDVPGTIVDGAGGYMEIPITSAQSLTFPVGCIWFEVLWFKGGGGGEQTQVLLRKLSVTVSLL